MKKILLPLLLILFLLPIQTNALTLSAGKSEPADDCVFVVVNGDLVRTGIAKACFDMNLLRKEACEEGVINPNTGMPLKKGDFTPIYHSTLLDQWAQRRAAECTIQPWHIRPGSDSNFTNMSLNCLNENLLTASWECNPEDAYNMFKSEKPGGLHYLAMINPLNTYVGMACIQSDDAENKSTCVMVFSQKLGASDSLIAKLKNNSAYKPATGKSVTDQKAEYDEQKKAEQESSNTKLGPERIKQMIANINR